MKALTVIVVSFALFASDVMYNTGESLHWLASVMGLI